jgi:ribosome biogenesis GTPase
VLARVAVSQRDRYQLFTAAGELPAEASGALWHRTPDRSGMPVTGDWVAARIVDPSFAIVEDVLPRKTVFSRRAAGRREDQQAVAANIDLVFLVCGLDGDFNLRRTNATSRSLLNPEPRPSSSSTSRICAPTSRVGSPRLQR